MKILFVFALIILISMNFVSAQKASGSFTITAQAVEEANQTCNEEQSINGCIEQGDSFLSTITKFFKKIFGFLKK